jgi:ABC-type anion transport system duplicated permease subunit
LAQLGTATKTHFLKRSATTWLSQFGAILFFFTGQVWNMAFSVYSSLRNIPHDMLETAQVYQLSRWQKFLQL